MKSFQNKVKQAHLDMRSQKLDLIEIPDAKGMKLAKFGTSAAKEKDFPGNVLQQIELEGEVYIVCVS